MTPTRHPATVTLGGQLLGTAQVPSYHARAVMDGFTYICPHCGDSWAKITIPGRPHMLLSISCKEHMARGHSLEVPGSLWLDWLPELGASFGRAVLLREVLIHHEWSQRHAY